MTNQEKARIIEMRSNGEGYNAIAETLKLSINTVKTFCRRNNLTGMRAVPVHREDLSSPSDTDRLMSGEKGGNSTAARKPSPLGNTGVSADQQPCRVTISFAEESKGNVLTDVLGMLMQASICKE